MSEPIPVTPELFAKLEKVVGYAYAKGYSETPPYVDHPKRGRCLDVGGELIYPVKPIQYWGGLMFPLDLPRGPRATLPPDFKRPVGIPPPLHMRQITTRVKVTDGCFLLDGTLFQLKERDPVEPIDGDLPQRSE